MRLPRVFKFGRLVGMGGGDFNLGRRGGNCGGRSGDERVSAVDDPFACPDCEAHMVKIGIDLYRCTDCRETFEATEVE